MQAQWEAQLDAASTGMRTRLVASVNENDVETLGNSTIVQGQESQSGTASPRGELLTASRALVREAAKEERRAANATEEAVEAERVRQAKRTRDAKRCKDNKLAQLALERDSAFKQLLQTQGKRLQTASHSIDQRVTMVVASLRDKEFSTEEENYTLEALRSAVSRTISCEENEDAKNEDAAAVSEFALTYGLDHGSTECVEAAALLTKQRSEKVLEMLQVKLALESKIGEGNSTLSSSTQRCKAP